MLDSSAGIDRSFITSGCARCRDSMLSLGRLRQSQYGVGTQACVVGVELGGVSQAEAVAAIASASAGSLTDQRGLRTWWLGCAVYPSARRPGSPTVSVGYRWLGCAVVETGLVDWRTCLRALVAVRLMMLRYGLLCLL